jgi:hypothetical protein
MSKLQGALIIESSDDMLGFFLQFFVSRRDFRP